MSYKQTLMGFCGSRDIKLEAFGLVKEIVRDVLAADGFIHVGCCVGVDEMVLDSVMGFEAFDSCKVFSAFGADGVGACGVSAVRAVSRFNQHGGQVSWWSGGDNKVKLRFRLANRTRKVVSSVSSLVAFVSSASSTGTWLAIRSAISRQIPVFIFPVKSFSLPCPGKGSWRVAGGGVWSQGFRWDPDQKGLFG